MLRLQWEGVLQRVEPSPETRKWQYLILREIVGGILSLWIGNGGVLKGPGVGSRKVEGGHSCAVRRDVVRNFGIEVGALGILCME